MSQLLIGVVFAVGISLFSHRMRFLTADGAVAQCILGVILLGIGGWQWTVPMLLFFLSSSILSRIKKSKHPDIESRFSKTSTRDWVQVVANGGIAGGLVLVNFFTPDPLWYAAYAGSVAAVTADTWGTELGTLSRKRPLLITTLRPVDTGTSGAVSLAGLAAGVGGALLIFLATMMWYQPGYPSGFIPVVAGGFVGSLADSLMGATLQVQFRCGVCGMKVEKETHCDLATVRSGGFVPVTNDVVNFLASAVGGIAACLLFLVF
jgi:uncharacterized protein (TIGR00297 family)